MAPPAMRVPAREWSQQEPPPEDWDLPQPAPREPSVLVDLSELAPVVRIPALAVPSVPRVGRPSSDESEPSLVPAGVPRRRRLVWLVLLLVVAGAAAFGCVRRDALQPLARTWALRMVQSRPVAAVRAFVSHPRGGSDAPH